MKVEKLKTNAGGDLVMLLVGDVFVQRDKPESVFYHVQETLRSTDFLLGNLEGSVADSGTLWSVKETQWKADARQIAAVESVGFDAMACANNHVLDFGYEAMFETLGHLDRAGIAHTGAGADFEEAHKCALVERAGCKVALLGYTSVFVPSWAAGDKTPGLAVMRARTAYEAPSRVHEVPGTPPIVRTWVVEEDKKQLAQDIAAAQSSGAHVIVCSFHWGVSRGHREIADYQIELAHHAVDLGADIVFGHHPHVTQGVEVYRGKAIFYSLGNFTFAQHNPEKGHEPETMIVKCMIRNQRITDIEYIPIMCDSAATPHLCDESQQAKIHDLIKVRSKRFGTDFVLRNETVGVPVPEPRASALAAAGG